MSCRPTCDIELKSHDEEVEDLAEEEEEGVAVVLVLQVVSEGPQQALQLVVLVLDDPVRRPLGQELHQTCGGWNETYHYACDHLREAIVVPTSLHHEPEHPGQVEEEGLKQKYVKEFVISLSIQVQAT